MLLHKPMRLLPLLLAGSALAQTVTTPSAPPAPSILAPAAQRISDERIQADHRGYEALQTRIKGLNDRGRPVRDYHLSKAQCWLDVSFHEYTRNDRSAFVPEALGESQKLVQLMERNASPLPMETPLVNKAPKLRPDLWEKFEALKRHSGFKCAQQKTACGEVELVHAGNEHAQQGWRHAKPYVQIAEDLLAEAQTLADQCLPPAPPPAPPVPIPPLPPPPAPPPVQEVVLSAHVVFNFDKHDAKNMRPFSVVQLEELVRRVQRDGLVLQSVRLSGHADRLNSTGNAAYNQQLSEQRVATVRAELVRLGVDDKLVSTVASGDAQQVVACEARFRSNADLQECLLPNRRVEVQVTARRR